MFLAKFYLDYKKLDMAEILYIEIIEIARNLIFILLCLDNKTKKTEKKTKRAIRFLAMTY
jgi:hypothetical protein